MGFGTVMLFLGQVFKRYCFAGIWSAFMFDLGQRKGPGT